MLHRYGGIFERGSKEYTLDDFYALQLDKLDKYVCLKESDVVLPVEGEEETSSDDEDEEDDEEDEEDPDEDTLVISSRMSVATPVEEKEIEGKEAEEREIEEKEEDVSNSIQ